MKTYYSTIFSPFFFFLSIPQFVLAQDMMTNWWDTYRYTSSENFPHMMSFGFGIFGIILMILIWVLIISGIVTLTRWILRHNKTGWKEWMESGSALDILRERYARGEIEKKEFEEKKKDLE